MRWKTHGTRQFNKTKETINLFSLGSCHAKETTGHCGPVLVGSLNGDLTGVKLAAGAGCGNPIAFLVLSAVPDVAVSLPTALGRDWSQRSQKSYEKILPFVGKCSRPGRIDVDCRPRAGDGQALARSQTPPGLPHRGQEESCLAARSQEGHPLQGEALLVALVVSASA